MTSSSGMAYPAGSAGFAGLITVQDAGRRAITRKEAYPVSGEAYDEAALLLAARQGDSEAFGEVVKKYMPRALAFAARTMGNADDAQDAVQDAFVKAYRGLGSFKGESSFYTWFMKVLSNLCLDRLRKAALVKRVFFFVPERAGEDDGFDVIEQARDENPGTRPEHRLEQKELRAALTRALRALPGRQRVVFLLKHDEGLKVQEIAGVLGISEGAVKSHLFRAVGALRKAMKAYEGQNV
ncbi:MAG TPA: sigma-70 family RNA polymerase sigma factor [Nitrospirota bacterium]|nr:sigma-70 family RNA polymerase sigma factor [Nitrospirota bacterium]